MKKRPEKTTVERAAVFLDPKKLVPWDKNPRVNDHAVESVMKSIQEFGFASPIVARKENLRVIGGHTRLKAALKLGLKKVPVRLLDVTEKQADLLTIADNKLGEKAEWDEGLLANVLTSLKGDGLDLLLAGFNTQEISLLTMEPDFRPTSGDEQGKLDQKSPVTCPHCGQSFTPK